MREDGPYYVKVDGDWMIADVTDGIPTVVESGRRVGVGPVMQTWGPKIPSPDELMRIDREIAGLRSALANLASILDSPQTSNFLDALKVEAAHQVHRWGVEHDAGKAPEDWFWLLGYLAGKAVHAAKSGDREKALHHTISSGAVLFNWHRALSGTDTRMRPGIAPPKEE